MRLIRLATMLIALACGAYSPPAPADPPNGYAKVIAYRIRHDISAVYAHHLWIDGKAAADLIPGAFSEFHVRAGAHRARTGDAGDLHRPELVFDAKAGASYYFRYGTPPIDDAGVELLNPDARAGQLRLVTESFARRELERFRVLPAAVPALD